MPKPFGAATSTAPPQLHQPQSAGTGHTSPAGANVWQPPTIQAQHAPVAHTTPTPPVPDPPPPPPPAPVSQSR